MAYLGIKERQKYRDVSWLMPAVDVVNVLTRLGAERISANGEQVKCLCPDHQMFVDRISSHPNWICDINSGLTYCRTEPRGSNLLWTVCRLLGCEPQEAVRFMTGQDISNLQCSAVLNRIGRMRKRPAEKATEPVKLDDIRTDLENRYISDACYQFFVHPPGKAPTNILKDTVDYYRVFERRWGYYSNRAIVPFFMRGELVGFCAIDLLGERQWLLEHPVKDADDYRKTLYPLNFRARECLFGFDDCEKGEEVIVTEGAREVMKLRQEGFRSVGCLKAELSDEQIVLLSELSPSKVVLMFDGDAAGYAATDKNSEKLNAHSVFNVGRCYLPVGKDPKNLDANDIHDLMKRCKWG